MLAQEYFEHTRKDIAPLLPARANRVLEIGCGTGSTLAWIKTLYPGIETVGVEGNGSLKERLGQHVDEAIIADLNCGVPAAGDFDLILALDVLEHLKSAEETLSELRKMLAPGGTLIISLPNIAYWSIGVDLLIFGRFEYEDAGIMDRTHLRFFTEKTARELIESAGFRVQTSLPILSGRKNKILDIATLGTLRMRLSSQIIFKAEH